MSVRIGERSLVWRRGVMPAGQYRWSLYLGPLVGAAIFHADSLPLLVALVRRQRRSGMGIYFATKGTE